MHADYRGAGAGRTLAYAIQQLGADRVDVNEQNETGGSTNTWGFADWPISADASESISILHMQLSRDLSPGPS
ncbi:MAG: hypothetical protein U0V70_18935 [Terriglobia bacterium]